MNPTIPLSIGFALRLFLLAFDPQSQLRPILIGTWEGIALYRGLFTTSIDAYISLASCALRLLFDCFFTENVNTTITLVFSLVLSLLISDVVGSHHGHDIQPSRRSDVERQHVGAPRSTRVYEVSEPRRINRTRLIPHTNREMNLFATRVSPVVQTETRTRSNQVVNFVISPDRVSDAEAHNSPSPRPAGDSPFLVDIPNPITPPCTPPQRISSSSPPEDVSPVESGSHEDELQTPLLLVVPQTLALEAADVTVGDVPIVDDADQDELQTPLALNLRTLPLTLEQDQPRDETRSLLLEDIPVPDDSASILEADLPEIDPDNLSELSLQTGTELSIISATNAQIISAKAELLRKQAWAEENQLRTLKEKLDRAVSQNRIKETFLLRRQVESATERARKLHGSAARRHFRARNLANRDGTIDVHGLFIVEAVKKVETALEAAILNGRKELRVIVGRGLHSQDRRPKLRPAIMGEMQKHSIPCRIQADNPGVLILTVPS